MIVRTVQYPRFVTCIVKYQRRLKNMALLPGILFESIHPVHSFMQYSHDTNLPGRQLFPIDKVPLVDGVIPADFKLGRNRPPDHFTIRDLLESFKQTIDIMVSLFATPLILSVMKNLFETFGCRFADQKLWHYFDS